MTPQSSKSFLASVSVLLAACLCACGSDGSSENPAPVGPTPIPAACSYDLSALAGSVASGSASFTDTRDGTAYPTVTIAGREWFARNLRFSPEFPGSSCPGGTSDGCALAGRLYDWWALAGQPRTCNEGSCSAWGKPIVRGTCPVGWRIPTKADFEALVAALGGQDSAGNRMKSTSGWLASPSGASGSGSNSSGFTALPGGSRSPADAEAPGGCVGLGSMAAFWISEPTDVFFEPPTSQWLVLASGTSATAVYSVRPDGAASVRCVRDASSSKATGI